MPSAGGSSTRAKVIGVIAALLIVGAVFALIQTYRNSQPHVAVQINLPTGSSEKMQAMKAQQQGKPEPSDESPSDRIKLPGSSGR